MLQKRVAARLDYYPIEFKLQVFELADPGLT